MQSMNPDRDKEYSVIRLDEVEALLEQVGFDVAGIYDYIDRGERFGGPGSERSHRVVFVARRPADVAESPT